jgi:hypothetical protein
VSRLTVFAVLPEPPSPTAVDRLGRIAGAPVVVSPLEPYASSIAPDGAEPAAPPSAAMSLVEVDVVGADPADLADIARTLGGDGLVALVERHQQLAVAGPPATGPRFVSCFTRAPGLTRAQFWEHWTMRHVPLVLGSSPGFDGYMTGLVRDATEPVDGVVEQTFRSDAALRAHHGSVHEKPDVVADAARFVGRARSFVAGPGAGTSR